MGGQPAPFPPTHTPTHQSQVRMRFWVVPVLLISLMCSMGALYALHLFHRPDRWFETA